MSIDPVGLRRFAEDYAVAWRSMDPDRVARHFANNGSLAVNDGAPAVGRDAIAATARGFYTALPDMQVYFDDLVIDGPRIEFHWTFTGTNTGPAEAERPFAWSATRHGRSTTTG
jgi:uncharacterized protein (TIGR02246 family)